MLFSNGSLYSGFVSQNGLSYFDYGAPTAWLQLLGYSNIGIDNFYKTIFGYDERTNIFR